MPAPASPIHLLDPKASYDAFLTLAASLLLSRTPPDAIEWNDSESGAGSLFDPTLTPDELASFPRIDEHTSRIAERLGRRGKLTAHHADPDRWDLLYRIAYRLSHGRERDLLWAERNLQEAIMMKRLGLMGSGPKDVKQY